VEAFLGEIRLLPYNFAPRGWAACNGELLPISSNQALFSLLGTNFGGDGMTNFGLPNLPSPLGGSGIVGYCICVEGVFPSRD